MLTEFDIQISQTEIYYFTQPTIFRNVEVILDARGEVWAVEVILDLRGEVRAHKTNLTSPLFVIEVSVPSRESGRSCICVCMGY